MGYSQLCKIKRTFERPRLKVPTIASLFRWWLWRESRLSEFAFGQIQERGVWQLVVDIGLEKIGKATSSVTCQSDRWMMNGIG